MGVVLTVVTLVAGLAIGFTWDQTKTRIEEQEKMTQQSALSSVFPAGVTIEEHAGAGLLPSRYWTAVKDAAIVGYAFQDSSRGFEKDIKIVVGISSSGTILGLNVLSQSETPGLGTRVQEVASKKYVWNALSGVKEQGVSWFTQQFAGIDLSKPIGVRKGSEWHSLNIGAREELVRANDISAITGATISTRAVVAAVTKRIPGYLSKLRENK
jgi:electron transport complex protein RnfG